MTTPTAPEAEAGRSSQEASLRELARFFFGLSVVGFGGPAAHLSIMQRELVERRGWLSQAEFLDLLGATNLIPGPNSTEMAIHIGHRRAGIRGLAGRRAVLHLSGGAYHAGSGLAVRALWSPAAGAADAAGIQASVVAVVGLASLTLSRTALSRPGLRGLAALAFAAALAGLPELPLFFGGGLLYLLSGMASSALLRFVHHRGRGSCGFLGSPRGCRVRLLASGLAVSSSATTAVSLPALGWFLRRSAA